ncbi:MAG: 4-hydroxy-tetrahydrodipicolinate synthase [Chitinophagaceae bacterium]|nr:4-hydroxy-tetrahydrodipicolinate synthase [Chitinophagaceae bacterium]
MSTLRQQLNGTGVALVTPFTAQHAIDFVALGKVIEAMIAGGVEYLVALGTTGETPALDKQEKKDIVQFTMEKVAGRVPVVVGAGGNNTAELVKELESFPLDQAAAVLSAAPYYNKPSQEGLYQHYKAVAAASPKPVILYNVPGRTGRNMSAATTLRLANEVPNILGIKEASGDMAQCMEILRDKPADFMVVSGDDALALPQIACGMEGVISVAANAFPRAFSDMVRAALRQDFVSAKSLNDPLIKAYDLMFAENNPAGVKAFMFEQGLIQNEVRLPVVPLSSGLHAAVKAYLKG